MRGKLLYACILLPLIPAIMGGCVVKPPADKPATSAVVETEGPEPVTLDAAVTFIVAFDQDVSGFTDPLTCVQLLYDGTVGGQVTITSIDKKTYHVTVTGVTGEGTFTLVIPQGAARDAKGKPTAASTSKPVSVDAAAPHIAAITSNTPDGLYAAGADIHLEVSFSKPVTLSGGVMNLTLNSGRIVAIPPFAKSDKVAATYKVQAGDNTLALDCTGVALASGAKASDASGNAMTFALPASNLGKGRKIVIDATAPTVKVNALTTNDATPALTGTVNDPKAKISVSVAGKTYGATNNGNGTWALEDNKIDPALTAGTYDVAVTATDEAGNAGHDTTKDELKIDTTGPVVTVEALLTKDSTPPLSGKVDDPTARISVDIGGKTYDAVNNGNGTWTLADNKIAPALADGPHDVAVTATDPAGNIGKTTATGVLVIDTIAPLVAVAPLVSKEHRPAISGSVDDAAATVTVTIDGSAAGTATNNGDGTWSFTPGADIPDGKHNLAATASDGAGNSATATQAGGLTVDSELPVVTVNPVVGTDASPALGGTVTDVTATTVKVTVGGSQYDAVVNSGAWTLAAGTIAPLGPGKYSVAVSATDAAGNVGTNPGTDALTVIGPAIVTASQLAMDNSYVDVTFDEPVYGDAANSLPVSTGSFVPKYTQNDDPVTGVTIGAVTAANGSALVGGETVVRVGLSLQGGPTQGLGLVSIAAAVDAVYNTNGQACTSASTDNLRLHDAANLLSPYDWSFENFVGDEGPDWNPVNAWSSSSYVHSGIHSIKFPFPTDVWVDHSITVPDDSDGAQYIDVGPAAGTKFTISAWVYLKHNSVGQPSDTGLRLLLKTEQAGGGFVTSEANFTLKAYDTWTQITYTGFTPAGITGHAWASFQTRATSPNDNDVFVDDLRMTLP